MSPPRRGKKMGKRFREGQPAKGWSRNPGTKASIIPPMGIQKPPKIPKKKPPSGPTGPPSTRTGTKKPPPNPNRWLQDILDSIYGPQQNQFLDEITRTRASAARQAAEHQRLMAEYAKWYGMNIPAQINAMYGSAATQQAGFGKGFSDGMQIIQDKAVAESNKSIGLSGAPAEAMLSSTSDAADVLYGIGGYIPGSSLSAAGAAYGAAAALMPGAIVSEASKNAAKIIAAAEETIGKLEEELGDLETKRGEAGLKISEARRAESLKIQIENRKHALAIRKQKFDEDLDRKKLRLSMSKEEFDQFMALKRLGFDMSKEEFDQWYGRTQVDLASQRIAISQANLALGQARFDLSKWKAAQPVYRHVGDALIAIDPKTGKWAVLVKGQKKKKPRFSAQKQEEYRSQAEQWMAAAQEDGLTLKDILNDLPKQPFPRSFGLAALQRTNPGLGNALLKIGKTVSATNKALLKAFGVSLLPKADAALSGGKNAWLASLWIQAGGDPAVAGTAAAIAMAESGGRVNAWNPKGLDKSAGLWQINYHGKLRKPRTRQFGPPELLRRDPLANARAAVAIYKSAGGSFSPWTTYTSGAYKKHLSGPMEVSLNDGGPWAGSLAVADQYKSIATQFGLSASGKRSTKKTASGGVSDHWTGSKNAFAYDLSGTVARMDKAAMALARALGITWDGKSELIEDVYVGPYRIQIIYNTPKYGGHEDHIHFGVRRVGSGGAV